MITYLALHFVLVDVGEIVFWQLKSDGKKYMETVQNFSVKGLDSCLHVR